MKLHTNVIGYTQQIKNALNLEIEAGRIAPHVNFKKLEQAGSRTHQFAFEIQLEAAKRDNGRRAGNSGSYGAMRPEYDGFAATYDEWGWLINAIYEIDPDALWGSAKYPAYKNRVDFDEKTGMTYHWDELLPLLIAGHWPTFVGQDDYDGGDPYPFTRGRQIKSRAGAGRITRNDSYFWKNSGWYQAIKHAPRSPQEYAAFAQLEFASS